jgi:hypothetical protein
VTFGSYGKCLFSKGFLYKGTDTLMCSGQFGSQMSLKLAPFRTDPYDVASINQFVRPKLLQC